MKSRNILLLAAGIFTPAIALAQSPNYGYVQNLIDHATSWLGTAVTVIMVLMTLFFLLSVFRFIREKKPDEQAKLKKSMLNSLLGLFIAVSVWGIIHLAGSIFGVEQGSLSNHDTVTCPPGFQYDPVSHVCR